MPIKSYQLNHLLSTLSTNAKLLIHLNSQPRPSLHHHHHPDSPSVPLVTLPPTIQDTFERSLEQLRETLGGQVDGLKAEKEQQQLAFDKYRERSRQGEG